MKLPPRRTTAQRSVFAWLGVWAACSSGNPVTAVEATTGASTSSSAATSSEPAATTSPASVDGTGTTGDDSPSTGPGEPPPAVFDVAGVADLGDSGLECSSDLTEVIDMGTGTVVETCPPHLGCADGMCVGACAAAASAGGSLGCEFFIPTPPFVVNDIGPLDGDAPCHALFVSNTWGRPAMLELVRDGVTYDIPLATRIPDGIGAATTYDPLPFDGVPVGEVALVTLSYTPGMLGLYECPLPSAAMEDFEIYGTGQGHAFSLSSDTPVHVYDILPFGGGGTSFLPSASLILPTSAWSDGYLLITPHEADGSEWLAVVAGYDDTTVSIEPTVALAPGTITNPPPGLVTQYTLDAGEVLQWRATSDPVGTLIAADEPIGVLSGNTYLHVDTADNPVSGRDCAHQMIPGVDTLGFEYVGAGLLSRLAGFAPESVRYRLVGVVGGTVFDWDPAPPPGAPAVINSGEAVEFETRGAFSVRSQDEDHPFSLTQYMSGSLSGQPGCSLSVAPSCELGDEEWVMLMPPQQFLRSYGFVVDPTYGTSSLVLVRRAGPDGFEEVVLDCMGSIAGWQPVGNDGVYEYAHVELYRSGVGMVPACETSQHHAVSEGDFGVMVWGVDDFSSYGYPGGGNLASINAVDVDPTP